MNIMPNLINPSAAAQNFYNPYGNAPQYGVSAGSAMSGLGGLASMIPVVGPLIGAGMNMLGTYMQNQQQEEFFNEYMSPQARMSQMRAAGINPNAAAQGISGASAPQMNAAAPTGAFTGLGEQLGQSVNNALSAQNIAANTRNVEAQAEGQQIQNDLAKVELGMKPSMMQAELDRITEEANKMREEQNTMKEQVKVYQAEVDKLKEEKDTIIQERGLIEYKRLQMEADSNLKNATAALERLTGKYGVEPGSPYYNYYKACVDYGVDSEEAKSELNKLEKTNQATAKGTASGSLEVNYGHTGVVGQAVDAIRQFVGTGKDYGFYSILSGLGITFDHNNMPHFKPIDKLFGRVTRPSYDKWLSGMKSDIKKSQDGLINAMYAGKITKEEYSQGRKALDELSKGLDYNTYKETFGIKK